MPVPKNNQAHKDKQDSGSKNQQQKQQMAYTQLQICLLVFSSFPPLLQRGSRSETTYTRLLASWSLAKSSQREALVGNEKGVGKDRGGQAHRGWLQEISRPRSHAPRHNQVTSPPPQTVPAPLQILHYIFLCLKHLNGFYFPNWTQTDTPKEFRCWNY